MAKIIPISEHFQHFLAEMKESFWGDLYGQTKLAWQRFFELQSERQRDRYSGFSFGRSTRAMRSPSAALSASPPRARCVAAIFLRIASDIVRLLSVRCAASFSFRTALPNR